MMQRDLLRWSGSCCVVLILGAFSGCMSGEDYAGGEPLGPSTDASPDGKAGAGGVDAGADASGGATGQDGAAGSVPPAGSGGSSPNLCGNGKCDPGETCGSCPGSAECCCGNGQCDPGEFCGSCGTECCCGNGTCEPGEVCGSCGTECCCGNGTCDPGEVCGGCGKECCCGNGTCENGEKCGDCGFECCSTCRVRCCNKSLSDPHPVSPGDTDACWLWGATVCGSADATIRIDVDGAVQSKPNRCWFKCTNYTTYHLLPGNISSGCSGEAGKVCTNNQQVLKNAAWQYCDPNDWGLGDP